MMYNRDGAVYYYSVSVWKEWEINMILFEQVLAEPINVLPKDGVVHYYGEIMHQDELDYYFNVLLNEIEWRCDHAVIFGK